MRYLYSADGYRYVFLVSYYHIKTLILKWPLDKSEETSGNCIAVRRAKSDEAAPRLLSLLKKKKNDCTY